MGAIFPKILPKGFLKLPRFFRDFPTLFQLFSDIKKVREKAFYTIFLLVTLQCETRREAPSEGIVKH